MRGIKELTTRQLQVLKILYNFITLRRSTPTIRELQAELGFKSSRAVVGHLIALEKKGYIERDSSARGIRILKYNDKNKVRRDVSYLPLVGCIAAGEPLLAQENIEEWIPVPTNMVHGKRSFLLRANGDSMVNAHILDGDLLVVCPEISPVEGDIVVALIGGEEATVKRLFKKKNKVELHPENKKYKPIIVKGELIIQGKVTGVLRSGNLI